MDTTPTHQAPSGPMTRACAHAIESEVSSLLFELDMNMDGTWLLPHHGTLSIIRYKDDPHQEAKASHQVQEEGQEGCMKDGGQQLEEEDTPRRPREQGLSIKLLATTCA